MNEIAQDYKMQGFSMMGVEKYKEAAALFEKSLELEKTAEVYMDLGNAYASMEEYDSAISAFSNALTLNPDNGEILFNIGCVYLLQERLKKCIEYYNRAEAAGYDKNNASKETIDREAKRMSKTCTYCGSVLKENAKFCTQCGRAVIAESPQRVEQRKSCGDMPGERNSGKAAMEQRNSGSSTPGQAHGINQL